MTIRDLSTTRPSHCQPPPTNHAAVVRPKYWEKYGGQLAAYADGTPYDARNGQRHPWPTTPNREWGVIIHGDVDRLTAGEPDGFSMFMVDLNRGRRLAYASSQLREAERDARKAVTPR